MPEEARRHARDRRPPRLATVTFAVLVLLAPNAAGLLEVTVLDGLVAELDETPTAADPGPIVFSTTDGLTFSSGLTDLETAWYAEIASARNASGAQSATIQGATETFSAWFYGRQGSAARFASFNATGTYDGDAGSYTVPLLFTKSSQGTIIIRSYAAADPDAGATDTTYHWAYDAGTNRYVIGATKDLSLATGIAPISDPLGLTFTQTLESNPFVIRSVGAGPDYLPVLIQGAHWPLLSLPGSTTWYVLMDTPAGVHADTYKFSLQVTAVGL